MTSETFAVPIESAAAIAGVSVRVVRLLVERGRLVSEVEDDVEMIEIASLVAYLNERPAEMRFPPRVRPHETRKAREGVEHGNT